MSRASLKKKTKKIKTSLRKSGIKTLQDVLNTSILSNDAKIKYIRHQFTCYEKYTKFFYRDNEGLALRKELNKCIEGVLTGKHTIEDLKRFNRKLNDVLKVANDNYLEEQKLSLLAGKDLPVIQVGPTSKADAKPCDIPYMPDLTDKEKECLKDLPYGYCNTSMTEQHKEKICRNFIRGKKYSWLDTYMHLYRNKNLKNCCLVDLYLENRDTNYYPENFSDLDFINWRKVVEIAKTWLLARFDNDTEKYSDFINITLEAWLKNNTKEYKSKLVEKMNDKT